MSEIDEIRCVWFFLPLPHPIGLPEGWLSEQALPSLAILNSPAPISPLVSSLRIHQMNVEGNYFQSWLTQLTSYAGETMYDLQVDAANDVQMDDEEPRLTQVTTIAEVAVPGYRAENAEILEALDIAIKHVREIQRSVAFATESPVRLLARQTLPPILPYFFGTLHSAISGEEPYGQPETRGSRLLEIPQSAPPITFGLTPPMLDRGQLERAAHFADRATRGDPYAIYADLRRDAQVQRNLEGNPKLAVTALATAGEVLLDTVLLQLLWEERVSPEEAASTLDRTTAHRRRVARNLAPRLGGPWDANSGGPPGRYFRDLVQLRHRVVHAGHAPSEDELDRAWTALFNLETYLGDRLCEGANLSRYPRTALAFAGERGIIRRGRWSARIESIAKGDGRFLDFFFRWRRHVDRVLDPAPLPYGSDRNPLALYFFRSDVQEERWIIHDSAGGVAAEAEPGLVLDRGALKALGVQLAQIPPGELVIVATDIALPTDEELRWRPEYELIEGFDLYAE